MHFRAKGTDIGCIHQFTRVINTICKLAKVCTVRITHDNIFFILPEQVANGGVSIWCELKQENFFDEYQMGGVDAEKDEIYLEIITENFSRALKTAQNAKSLKIKLTKKQSPCLTVEIELPSVTSASRSVMHDIPVSVIPSRHWCDFVEPDMPDFNVSVYMPTLKSIKGIVDNMKNLSSYLTLSANQDGDLTMKVETDLVTVSTRFQDLQIPSYKENENAAVSMWQAHEFASARVDIKRFIQFLSAQQINPDKVICNIVDRKVVHLFLVHDDMALQYFLPDNAL